ncbi:MAG TPA: ATP-binding protein [Thermoanaerobaculia bacterium]|nr:ATP-binding protein [Thermoanaerobaculia bacterium]
MRYERRILITALAALAPVAIIALLLVWTGDYAMRTRWTTVFIVIVATFLASYALHEQLVYPLRTISNLITALREEDYSLRARAPRRDDALGDILAEVNALSELMESRKLEAIEATALLRAVLAEIDAAIFAFDGENRLRLVNRAGERLLDAPRTRVEGLTAAELGLDDLLAADAPPTMDRHFPGGAGRWNVRRSSFREHGVPHRLLVVADISRALREEETEAWRRIVRVIGHELNNSLAPIKSISASIEQLVAREPLPGDWREDLVSGMRVIGSRTEALTRFTRAYAQLARLPEPRKRDVNLAALVRRVAALETRVRVDVNGGPDLVVPADEDQLEQLLINIIKNAAEASLPAHGGVRVRWRVRRDAAQIFVEDEGAGLSGSANLFVPFFTTKPGGTGVGLVLSRQIAEAHGGSLTLENRQGKSGCVATLTLPAA